MSTSLQHGNEVVVVLMSCEDNNDEKKKSIGIEKSGKNGGESILSINDVQKSTFIDTVNK